MLEIRNPRATRAEVDDMIALARRSHPALPDSLAETFVAERKTVEGVQAALVDFMLTQPAKHGASAAEGISAQSNPLVEDMRRRVAAKARVDADATSEIVRLKPASETNVLVEQMKRRHGASADD